MPTELDIVRKIGMLVFRAHYNAFKAREAAKTFYERFGAEFFEKAIKGFTVGPDGELRRAIDPNATDPRELEYCNAAGFFLADRLLSRGVDAYAVPRQVMRRAHNLSLAWPCDAATRKRRLRAYRAGVRQAV